MESQDAYDGNPDRRTLVEIAEIKFSLNVQFNDENYARAYGAMANAISDLPDEYWFAEGITGITYVIEITEGSVIAKIKLYGAVAFVAICEYGSFEEGLERITNRVEQVADAAYESLRGDEKFAPIPVKTKIDKGLINDLKGILGEISYLENKSGDISYKESKRRLKKLKQKLANILHVLSDRERESALECLSPDLKNSLPKPDKTRVKDLRNLYVFKPDTVIFKKGY